MAWTLEALLDHAQELMGAPVGEFYNVSTRVNMMNHYQAQLVRDSKALVSVAELAVAAGQESVSVPADFLTFTQEAVTGDGRALPLVALSWLDKVRPGWQAGGYANAPLTLAYDGALRLSPAPESALTLRVPYVVAPTPMSAMADAPFNNEERLMGFAPMLSMRVAQTLLTARAPAVAQGLETALRAEERKLIAFVRSHKPLVLQPFTYRS